MLEHVHVQLRRAGISLLESQYQEAQQTDPLCGLVSLLAVPGHDAHVLMLPCHMLLQDLWEASMALFSSEINAEQYTLSQLLVPGQLSRAALREALSYHGARLSQQQIDEATREELQVGRDATGAAAQCCVSYSCASATVSLVCMHLLHPSLPSNNNSAVQHHVHAQWKFTSLLYLPAESNVWTSLQTYIRAAAESIAAKHPTYSPARCWHDLFVTYLQVWQQQHGLVSLIGLPNSSWLGCLRAGGMLTVLREASPPERLQQPGVLASHTAEGVVQSCLQGIRDVLGQPALLVMINLVMAGANRMC